MASSSVQSAAMRGQSVASSVGTADAARQPGEAGDPVRHAPSSDGAWHGASYPSISLRSLASRSMLSGVRTSAKSAIS
jgi:hypothetical protein